MINLPITSLQPPFSVSQDIKSRAQSAMCCQSDLICTHPRSQNALTQSQYPHEV